MTAQTGRTHFKWLQVFVDNAAGTLTDISSYVSNVGQFGLTYDTQDVTAFADAVAPSPTPIPRASAPGFVRPVACRPIPASIPA